MYQINYRWKGFPRLHTAYICASSSANAMSALYAQWDTAGKLVVEMVKEAQEGTVIVVA